MKSVRSPKPPPKQPTIVFAAVDNISRADVLRSVNAKAAMCTFQKMRRGKKHDSILEVLHSYNARTYLDSGVFQFVRRMGTTRINQSKKQLKPVTIEEFQAYAQEYLDYLKINHDHWDHIVELDVDEIFDDGEELAAYWRRKLYRVVGPKLMPAWHVTRGYTGWSEMAISFPYISIGSDKQGYARGDMKRASAGNKGLPLRELQHLINTAHSAGSAVHVLGDTRYDIFLKADADSGDSTAWIVGDRYGHYRVGHRSVEWRHSTTHRALRDVNHTSRSSQFAEMVKERFGLNMDDIKTGNQKFHLAALLMLDIQKEIRRARKSTQATS